MPELARASGDEAQAAKRYRDALAIAEALQRSSRLAPSDHWMLDDLRKNLAELGKGV